MAEKFPDWINSAGLARQKIPGVKPTEDNSRETLKQRAAALAQSYKILHTNNQRVRTALIDSPVMLFGQGTDLNFVWVENPIPGFTAEEMLGKTDVALFADDANLQKLIDSKAKVIQSGESIGDQFVLNRLGKEIVLWLSINPYSDAKGEIQGISCAALDVTELHHLRANADNAQAELQQKHTELHQSQAELLQARTVLHQTQTELHQMQQDLHKTREELHQTQSELSRMQGELQLVEQLQPLYQLTHAVFNSTQNAIFIADNDGNYVEVNDAACELTGYSREELIQTSVWNLTSPAHRPAMQSLWDSFISNTRHSGEYQLKRKDGTLLWVEYQAVSNMLPGTHLCVLRDVSARRTANESLMMQARVLESMAEGVVVTDQNGRIFYINAAEKKMFGYADGELVGKHVSVLNDYPADENQNVVRNILEQVKEKKAWEGELNNKKKDGTPFTTSVHISSIELSSQLCFIWVQTDITAHKHAEQALRRSEKRFELIMRTTNDAIWDWDLQTNEVWWNEGLGHLFGYPINTVETNVTRWYEHVHPDDRERVLLGIRAAIESGIQWSTEYRFLRADGTYAYVLDRARVRHEDGKPVRMLGAMMDITERKRAEHALKESEQRFRTLAEALPQLVWTATADGRFDYLSRQWCEYTGMPEREQVDLGWLVTLHPDDRKATATSWRDSIDKVSVFDMEFRIRGQDDQYRWFKTRGVPLRDVTGEVTRWFGTCTDINDHKRIENELIEWKNRYDAAIHATGQVLYDWDSTANELTWGGEIEAILGYGKDELAGGFKRWIELIHPEDQLKFKSDIQHVITTKTPPHLQYRVRHKDGRYIHIEDRGDFFRDSSGNISHLIGFITDVTVRMEAEEQLRYDAFHDSLTDLPNRALFLERLERAIIRAERHDVIYAVLVLDLDNFKVVNDSLGHLVGDELLIKFAHRINSCLRPADTLARFGGDEFTVLLDELENIDGAIHIVQRIHKLLQEPFKIGEHEIYTGASIGVALSDKSYRRAEAVLRDADTAMYRAKKRGKACHVVFDKTMRAEAVSRLQMESALRRAINTNEIVPYYQPIVDLTTGYTVGCEALARWQTEKNYVPPHEFISLAEESGLIVPLGELILEAALSDLAAWLPSGLVHPDFYISVNLSNKQFSHGNLVDMVLGALKRHGLPGSRLRLEITEGAIMKNDEHAAEVLGELRNNGVRICMDDFGTGYSSLSYLHRFPVDVLKVDQSFIQGLPHKTTSREIVKTIADLANTLSIEAVAEGAETAAHLVALQSMGIRWAQGYFFHRPMDNSAMAGFFKKAGVPTNLNQVH